MNGSFISLREISPREWTAELKFLVLSGIIILGFLLSSCISTIPLPQPHTSPPIKKTAPPVTVVQQIVPDGWADITSKSNRPEIKYWLINHDNSATMVLREFQVDTVSQKALMKEEMNVVTNISLLSKLPDNNSDYRITRVPLVFDTKRNLVSYAYSEKGLLRRVIVFKKRQKYFELELMQERSSAEFDELTNDLVTFAITLFDR